MKITITLVFIAIIGIIVGFGCSPADAQQPLAQQAYALIEHHCINCHGENGAFTEQLIIDHVALTAPGGAIIPGNPQASSFYQRLLIADTAKRMPLNAPPLSQQALETIHRWIEAGAPDWDAGPRPENPFISHAEMLTTLENHLNALPAFDRAFARYFLLTHLYNAGETPEVLNAYQRALAKLVNSLSWGRQVINPQPIDAAETLFYIDLRHYEWDVRDAWTSIENAYPYHILFDAPTQTALREKLTVLQGEMACEVPFIHGDWFLANASLPPLYHDILALPETDRELEDHLEVDVARNLLKAPGVRVWRAGLIESGVSNHNRVVERHESRYGAYWKSYDFAGSAGSQNITTHPLNFQHDGGEVVFNLPNGLQGYYISDAAGNRIDVAPTDIVSNPAASDPAVRNGLSCIGCHTEGMKTFEDDVRGGFLPHPDSPAKAQVLRLYVEQSEMDALVAEDTARFREALEATGGVFGGIEPVQRFYEVFQGPVDAAHAAAAVGLETNAFLQKIREDVRLQNLGLLSLEGANGSVKRDAWTAQFSEIVSALYSPESSVETPVVLQTEVLPGTSVHIPDANLRRVIEMQLGKNAGAVITSEDMERLTQVVADERDIRNLSGLESAKNLERIEFRRNAISDLTPLAGLTQLNNIKLRGNKITDVAPLAGLINVDWLGLEENAITDLSSLSGLVKLDGIGIEGNPISDVSSLAGMISLEGIRAWDTAITDFSALAKLPRLQWIEFSGDASITQLPSLKGLKTLRRLEIKHTGISDISGLSELTLLTSLTLSNNLIKDVSPLASLKKLTHLNLENNLISDVSPLAGLNKLERLYLRNNAISDFSPLQGLSEKIYVTAEGNPGKFLHGAAKITGPWLWMIVPTGSSSGASAARSGVDFLSHVSDGEVTELKVATNGATEGNPVGDKVWAVGELSATGGNNLNNMANATGLGVGDINSHVAYGSLTLESPRSQQITMLVGSDDAVKVWLNGVLVHNNPISRGSSDYQDRFLVTLKEGKNVLLIAVYEGRGGWSGFFGFETGTEYTVLPPVKRFSLSTETTTFEKGDTFTLRLNAANITDLAGWQADVVFDPDVLKADFVNEGKFLKQDGGSTFFQRGIIQQKQGKITGLRAARTSEGGATGEGTLLSIRFTTIANGMSRVVLRNFRAGSSAGKTILTTPPEILIVVESDVPTIPAWDVNEDGVIDATDVTLVTLSLGQSPPVNPRVDVNGDGVVDGKDIARVAAHLGEQNAPAASSVGGGSHPDTSPQRVEAALDILWAADDGSLTFRRAIANLERLLAAFVPEQTTLLSNYPNPFNPETWIPYHLAHPADVTLRIYTANGLLVHTLDVGHQPAGIYQHRSRAAYWDGRNEVGEPVASGVYFYTLTADEFSATRKMLIQK